MIDLKALPKEPGVYIFKDVRGHIIYVGKAANLKGRVSSYFGKGPHSVKTQHLVARIHDLETIVVDNEVEALLLENRLIKKHQPRYNMMLKDAKTFAYIKITDEKYPRIVSTRRVTHRGKYFGPYTDGFARRQIIRLIIAIFKLRTCKLKQKRPCLNYHLGLCWGVCVGKITPEQYQMHVDAAIAFLKGDTKDVQQRLEAEMKAAAAKQQFEVAKEKKQQLEAIDILHQRQKVDTLKSYDQNVVALRKENGTVQFIVFSISRGVIAGKKEYAAEYAQDALESFIKLYYPGRQVPREILLSHAIDDKDAVEGYLTRLRGAPVTLSVPLRGEKRRLVELALKNIGVSNATLEELQRRLRLPTYPHIIECFDVSNLKNEGIVAGMTRWVDGVADLSGYRRFEMKTVKAQDDFASMREAVFRRYSRLRKEGKELPQLVIIDGGKGQLSAAMDALKEAGVSVPIIGLAKREEEIYVPGLDIPLKFNSSSQMMLLLRKIRDSVHRFAVSYQRKKRKVGG